MILYMFLKLQFFISRRLNKIYKTCINLIQVHDILILILLETFINI